MRSPEPYSGERPRRQYFFADFTLDLDRGFLWRGVDEIALRPKPFEVLAYLVEHHGRLVTKAELIQAVWPDAAVTDNSLAQCLLEVRRALADDSQQVIRTVPRRGHLFAAPVSTPVVEFPLQPAGPALPEPSARGEPARGPSPRLKWLRWAAAGLGVTVCIAAVWWLVTASLPRFRPTDYNSSKTSIAVLPFVNRGSDPDSEHLGEGISEDITNMLARIPDLRVVARTSAFRFHGSNLDTRDVGRQLGVAKVLEGSVRKAGDHLRITVQLVNTSDGYLVWSESYDRVAGDVLVIQVSIAEAIASNLKLEFAAAGRAALSRRRTPSLDAYNLVIKGRYLKPDSTNPDARINCFRQALEHDPEYSEAYAGMAGEWLRRAIEGSAAPREVMDKARDAVAKALQLEDSLPDAHFLSAMVKWTYEWDWPGADREFSRALQLNPNSAQTRVQYARYLALLGRRQEALAQLEPIRVLDPLSAEVRSIQAAVYFFNGDYDRTIRYAEAVLAGEPELYLMYFWLGRAYEAKGQLEKAITALERWHRIPGRLQGRGFGMLASTYARAGRKPEALRLLEWAKATAKQSHVSPASLALIYIGLGDHDRAFDWLEKAYEERDHSMVSLKADPAYNPLRGNPKFAALLRRVKLE